MTSAVPGKPFSCALDPLLARQRWEVDALGTEFSQAQAAVDEAQRQLQAAAQALAQLNVQWAALRREGAVIDPVREGLLQQFRGRQAEVHAAAAAGVDSAQQVSEQVRAQLTAASQRLRGYESQRERLHAQHVQAVLRLAERQADEAQLLTRLMHCDVENSDDARH
jgi:flagellar export protein FliJ